MKPVLQQHRIQKQQAFIRKIFFRAAALCAVCGSAVAIVLFMPQLSFHEVSIHGNESAPPEEIIAVAEHMLEEKMLGIFSRRSIFLFRPAELEARILAAFPVLTQATVSRSLRHGISITAVERAMWGVYCPISKTPDTNLPQGGCFYIATDGVLFADAPQLSGNVVFRITDMRLNANKHAIGERAVVEQQVSKIQTIAAWLSQHYDISLQGAVLGREFDDDKELVTSEGWYLRFDEETCIECAFEDLSLVFEKHLKKRMDLEYVDIRFEGKMFYRYRDIRE